MSLCNGMGQNLDGHWQRRRVPGCDFLCVLQAGEYVPTPTNDSWLDAGLRVYTEKAPLGLCLRIWNGHIGNESVNQLKKMNHN